MESDDQVGLRFNDFKGIAGDALNSKVSKLFNDELIPLEIFVSEIKQAF